MVGRARHARDVTHERMRRGWITLIVLLIPVVGGAFLPRVGLAEPSSVIWLSWDGVRHDQPDRATLPGLERMQREGSRADGLRPVFPSNTFPNHVSQATCATPGRHGVVANRFRDPERGRFDYAADAAWIESEPLWIAAERQGVRAAAYFWVGSETAWRGRVARDRMAPFDRSVRERAKVDQILAWLDRPADRRPRLVMTWWRGTDREGHRKGPDHPDVIAALKDQDTALVRLLEELTARGAWGHTTLVVTSDHGMAMGTQVIDAAGALADADVEATIESGGAVAFVYLGAARGEAWNRARSRAELALRKLEGHRVFRPADVPPELGLAAHRRVGDLVLIAQPPYFYAREEGADRWLAGLQRFWFGGRGVHGYPPTQRDMHGIFYAMGNGVPRSARPGTVSALDLAPTVSRLLGIDPPLGCEGQALPGWGADRTRSSRDRASAAGPRAEGAR